MSTRNYQILIFKTPELLHIFTKVHGKALKLSKMSKRLSLEETGLSHDQVYLLRQFLKEY